MVGPDPTGALLGPAPSPPVLPPTSPRLWLSPQGARRFLALFLGIKLAVTAWDCTVFDGQSYDSTHHIQRAATGGLQISPRSYDAPTYYLPALAYKALHRHEWKAAAARPEAKRKAEGGRSSGKLRSPYLGFLRCLNVFYVSAFYLLWVFGVVPRVLADWRAQFLASLLVLALPGYQKLAVMVHPDNLHLLMASMCAFLWVRMPGIAGTPAREKASLLPNLGLAVVAGLSGLTRPFAIATVATFTTANLLHSWIRASDGPAAKLRRRVLLLVLTAVIAGSWFVCRGVVSGSWQEVYPGGYMEQFDRRNFHYWDYFSSFHLRELLAVPNRRIAHLDTANYERGGYAPANRYANSFFTTLYSETWGDHWLYFSGGMGHERKALAKRLLFVFALPLVPLLIARWIRAGWQLARRALARGLAVGTDADSVLFAHVVVGAALFLYWQLGSGLSPGKQSSIKFIYNAYLYAPAITVCFVPRLTDAAFRRWSVYLVLLFVAALPMAVFVPRGW